VERTAAGWRALGVEQDTRVASFAWNSPQAVWAWFGAIGAGATYVLLNRLLRGPLLRDQLERSAPAFVVTELEALKILDEAWASGGVWYVFTDDEVPAGLVALNALRSTKRAEVDRLDPSAIGLITFTSGSTGRSKAVRLTHNSVVRGGCAYACGLGLSETDVIHGWNPLFHWGGMLFYALGAGAEYALYPRFSASKFWAQVAESGATFVEGFPVLLEYLLRQPITPDECNHTLGMAVVEIIGNPLVGRAHDRFGARLPLITLVLVVVVALTGFALATRPPFVFIASAIVLPLCGLLLTPALAGVSSSALSRGLATTTVFGVTNFLWAGGEAVGALAGGAFAEGDAFVSLNLALVVLVAASARTVMTLKRPKTA
jgi:acyl-CoA synthetase (AMP-forming)/AMP-acid ligase II